MVSVDDIETNTKFAESLAADFPLLSNEEKDVACVCCLLCVCCVCVACVM